MEDAFYKLADLVEECGAKESVQDNLLRVMEVGDAVEGLEENLVRPDRRFIYEAPLKIVTGVRDCAQSISHTAVAGSLLIVCRPTYRLRSRLPITCFCSTTSCCTHLSSRSLSASLSYVEPPLDARYAQSARGIVWRRLIHERARA